MSQYNDNKSTVQYSLCYFRGQQQKQPSQHNDANLIVYQNTFSYCSNSMMSKSQQSIQYLFFLVLVCPSPFLFLHFLTRGNRKCFRTSGLKATEAATVSKFVSSSLSLPSTLYSSTLLTSPSDIFHSSCYL